MIPGLTAVAVEAVASVPAADDHSVSNPVQLLMSDPNAHLVFVLVASPPSMDADPSGPPYPVASVAVASLDDTESVTTDTIYISDVGFQTDPTDTPANVSFPPRLTQPYNFQSSLALDGTAQATESFGAIEMVNADGALDYLLKRTWTGRRLEVRVGGTLNVGRADERRLAFSEFGTLFIGTADQLTATETAITIAIRDPMGRLSVPVQQTLYGGTGGADGGANLAGLPKPLGYGQVRNAGVPLVDSANLVYQLHDGAVQGVDAVRDSGAGLLFSADFASYAALIAATVAPGSYSTSLATGMIRLGATSAGQITCDFRGESSPGYVATHGTIMRRIATTRGVQPLTDPDEIDSVAFAALETSAPEIAGLWTGTNPQNVSDILLTIGKSIGAGVSFNRLGQLTASILAEAGVPVVTHTNATLANAAKDVEVPEPTWRVSLGYRHNWSPQPADGLAASISDSLRVEYSSDERTVVTQASGVLTRYKAALDISVSTLIDTSADAQTESNRRSTLLKVPRVIHKRDVAVPLFQFRLGETHRLVENRFGLDAGQNFVVIGLAEDAARRLTTVTLWG